MKGRYRILAFAISLLLLFAPSTLQQQRSHAAGVAAAAGAVIGILSDLLGTAKDAAEIIQLVEMVDSMKNTISRAEEWAKKMINAGQNAIAILQCSQQLDYCITETYSLFQDIVDYPAYAQANFGKDWSSSVDVTKKGIGYVRDITAELVSLKIIVDALKEDGNMDALTVRSQLSQMANAVRRARSAWGEMVYEDLGFRSPEQAQSQKMVASLYSFYGTNGVFSPSFTDGQPVKLMSSDELRKKRESSRQNQEKLFDDNALKEQELEISQLVTGPVMSLAYSIVAILGAICVAWQLFRYFNDSVEMGRDINPISNTFGKVGVGMVLFAFAMKIVSIIIGRVL